MNRQEVIRRLESGFRLLFLETVSSVSISFSGLFNTLNYCRILIDISLDNMLFLIGQYTPFSEKVRRDD